MRRFGQPRKTGRVTLGEHIDTCRSGTLAEADRQSASTARWIAVALPLVLGVFHYDTVATILGYWSTDGYSHGWLLPPLAAYLLWNARGAIARTPWRPDPTGLPVLLATSLGLWVGKVTSTLALEFLAFTGMLLAAIWCVLGLRMALRLAGPVLLLPLTVPVWEFAFPILQEIAAALSTALYRLTGNPILREGLYLHIPDGTFHVDKGCSGLRYLNAAAILALTQGLLEFRTILARCLWLVGAVGLAMFGNGIRIAIVVLMGQLLGMDHPWVTDHIVVGWLVFAALFVPCMLFLPSLLASVGLHGAAANGTDEPSSQTRTGPVPAAVLAAAFALVAFGGIGDRLFTPGSGVVSAYAFQPTSATWRALVPDAAPRPEVVGADHESIGTWTRSGVVIHGYVAEFSTQHQGKEAVNDSHRLHPEQLRVMAQSGIGGLIGSGSAHQLELSAPTGPTAIVRYWYEIGGIRTRSAPVAKLLELRTAILGGNSLIAVLTATGDDPDMLASALGEFDANTDLRPGGQSMNTGNRPSP